MSMQTLLTALEVLSSGSQIAGANTWLQDFQHTPEAWTLCNELLMSPDAPLAAKFFAAQTYRAKVTYDLHQVAPEHLPSFRDSLLSALQQYHKGPRMIITQLCIAVAGLALQLPTWDAVQSMIDAFAQNPETVPVLLEFLTVLPEELSGNTKIPVTDDEYRERAAALLTANSKQVIDLLAMYIAAQGVTEVVTQNVFKCLRSWLVAGEVDASVLAETTLFTFAFQALDVEPLFDGAVDVICELIHETQEIDDNMPVIELIVPRLLELRPKIRQHYDDPEKIRGYAKIFTEAGETYRLLLLHHTETFFPIVEAIGECSAYPDLDIVPITFAFWLRLAQLLNNRPSFSPLFRHAYTKLMSDVIQHLRFPSDPAAMVGQEAENFRSFRHIMGDTLKDCCLVLGTSSCLLATYGMITSSLSAAPELVSWQDIEAPLFAMRSMGAEIDANDTDAVPKIMGLIPSLPSHPRVRYASLLILSRYTEWVNKHESYIDFSFRYIIAAFSDPDTEVCAAAAQALKYLCQDCKKHMIVALPALQEFLSKSKLLQVDRQQVYEAVAYVISAMPMERAAEHLRSFSLGLLKEVHAVASKPTMADKAELQRVCDAFENLESMLHVIQGFGDELPIACQSTCEEAWVVFDNFLTKYGNSFDLSERTTRVLRHGLKLFGDAALSVAPSVMARMTIGFESTGFPSYVWIAGKLISRFGNEEETSVRNSFREMYARSTNKVVELLGPKTPREIPDVLEDYVQMLLQLVEFAPDIFFESPAFPLAFRAATMALTLVHGDIIWATLDLFRTILTHTSLDATASSSSRAPPPKYPIYAAAINAVVEQQGFELVGRLLSGLVGDFPESESTSAVVSIFRALSTYWPTQLLAWIPSVLEQLPTPVTPIEAKNQFFKEVSESINSGQVDKVKYAIINLHRASRKAKDRRREVNLA